MSLEPHRLGPWVSVAMVAPGSGLRRDVPTDLVCPSPLSTFSVQPPCAVEQTEMRESGNLFPFA